MAESRAVRWTIADLDALPYDEWNRYEIVDGELFVSPAPGIDHQLVCAECLVALAHWQRRHRLGLVLPGPGVIFGEFDSVIPDVVWVSRERLAVIEGEDGHLHGAPELVVEVLSPGAANERRDRETKLRLYSTQGVREYWVADWRAQTVQVYRPREGQFELAAILTRDETLTSPLLPGFALPVTRLFARE